MKMNRLLLTCIASIFFCVLTTSISLAEEQNEGNEEDALIEDTRETKKSESKTLKASHEEHSVLHKIALYIPNRILDTIDMVRARLRIGPGIAASIRFTDYADLFLGSYVSLYVGLPGPRDRVMPRSPIGVETLNGAELSVLKASTGFGLDPAYSETELGIGLHLALIGLDVGFDPVEIVDFIGGFFLFDIKEDDI